MEVVVVLEVKNAMLILNGIDMTEGEDATLEMVETGDNRLWMIDKHPAQQGIKMSPQDPVLTEARHLLPVLLLRIMVLLRHPQCLRRLCHTPNQNQRLSQNLLLHTSLR
jgi:hypothetical protein